MSKQFRPWMLLADAAQMADGKLYVIGGGWDTIKNPALPSALILRVGVAWDASNVKHTVELVLEDEDGRQVMAPSPDGGHAPVKLDGVFEVGRPVGVPAGMWLNTTLTLTIGSLPLQAGKRYVWRLSINHQSEDDWSLPFMVAQAPPVQAAA
jgi:hypothetical protein